MDTSFFLKWLIAGVPIIAVLILMVGMNWGGGRAGAAGWVLALLISVVFFGSHASAIAYSQMKAVLLSLNVLYIIWAALLLYHIVEEAGAIRSISLGIQRFSGDKSIQLLILGWVFSSFLQGVAGYGVPVAVVAPLLMSLGFTAVVAVAVPAIGHCWSVTFGSMGASFQALMAVTGYGFEILAPWCAILLGIAAYLCGISIIHLYGGVRMIRHGLVALLIIGLSMTLTQYGLAINGMWTVGGFGASLVGLAVSVLVARLPIYRKESAVPGSNEMPLRWAVSAYVILICIVSLDALVPPVKKALSIVSLNLSFPLITTSNGWTVKAGLGQGISVLGHGGALLVYASLLSYCLYFQRGCYKPGAPARLLKNCVKSGVPTSLGIVTMVGMALLMDHAGMIFLIADGISRAFGEVYPFFASWVGLLGAFMTGSNTNSNVLFGGLQKQVAELAGISAVVILAAQTTGGALGSMIAPAKIIVGCSTVGLSGQEGPVLKVTLKYGLVVTTLIGICTAIIAFYA
jgi:lactate permease